MSKYFWVLPKVNTKQYFDFMEQFIKDAQGMCQIQIHGFTGYYDLSFYFLNPELEVETDYNHISFRTLFYRTYGYLPNIPRS